MNQDTLTPELALRLPHPQLRPLWIGCGDSPSNVTLWSRVGLDTQVLLLTRDWGVNKLYLLNAFMLSPRGEHRTTALGWTGDWLTPGRHRVKLEKSCMAFDNSTSHTTWIHHGCMWLKGIPDLGGYLLNLIPCIKYLIWFKCGDFDYQLTF